MALMVGERPVVGVSALTGVLGLAAAPLARAHHGPADSASAHPVPGVVAVPTLDAAMHTIEPANSVPRPVAYQPPNVRAISTLVA